MVFYVSFIGNEPNALIFKKSASYVALELNCTFLFELPDKFYLKFIQKREESGNTTVLEK